MRFLLLQLRHEDSRFARATSLAEQKGSEPEAGKAAGGTCRVRQTGTRPHFMKNNSHAPPLHSAGTPRPRALALSVWEFPRVLTLPGSAERLNP